MQHSLFYASDFSKMKMSIRPWEVARSGKCFLYKQEDLSPRSVCGSEVCVYVCDGGVGADTYL